MSEISYGSWPSPVSVEMLTASVVGLSAPAFDGDRLYWLEARPEQAGRTSLWREGPDGDPEEVTPEPWNVRSRVNEYGGGEYAVAGGVVVFSELSDGRLYVIRAGGEPQPITPTAALRYADLRLHVDRSLVLAVREDHRAPGEPVTTLVALELAGDNAEGGRVLCSGADFYASPELSLDDRLAWTEWNHPNMPWEATAIMVGRLSPGPDGGSVADVQQVAGGPSEAAALPSWAPDGRLTFLSERTGWWNLYAWNGAETTALCPESVDFCGPPWRLRTRPYAWMDDRWLAGLRICEGVVTGALVDLETGAVTSLSEDAVAVESIVASRSVTTGRLATVLGSPIEPNRVAAGDLTTRTWRTIRSSGGARLDPAWISVATGVSWDSDLGPVHGWYYPPVNPGVTAPVDERPPLIVLSHGGPTALAGRNFSTEYQYWTSRGFALLDVNYGGSAGYGRAYRERLNSNWGVVDAADCIGGARAVAQRGLADPDRLVISGGSAGGYTTLRALTTSTVFAAGLSSYGIADLESLAQDTHKFESRYLDGLVGPYPEARDVYRDRSPIHHVDRLSAPILLLQGSEDAVVPMSQAELMADAVRQKGLPVALIVFEGEGHGFRRRETIQAATQAEQSFLAAVLGFTPADDLPDIEIENLPTR